MSNGVVAIGINGFGSVGRNVFFAALQDHRVLVAAINDTSVSAACMAYLIEHDCPSHMPALQAEALSESVIAVNKGIRVHVTAESRPTQWSQLGVQVVIECGGANTKERCAAHLAFGAQRVVIAAHSTDAPLTPALALPAGPKGSATVESCGSPLAAALIPFLRTLDSALGVEEVAYTAVSGPADEPDPAAGRATDPLAWRQLRLQQSSASAIGAFAPAPTQADAATLCKVFPALGDRVAGTRFQVPGQKGCAIELLVHTREAATKEELESVISRSAGPRLKFPQSQSEPMISTDCLGFPGLVYDRAASLTRCAGHVHKLSLWADLTWCYAVHTVTSVCDLAQREALHAACAQEPESS